MLLLLLLPFLLFTSPTSGCEDPSFQGFGIYLGSPQNLISSPAGTVERVLEKVLNELGIRHFRTSYESEFSPSPHNYTISCATSPTSCMWIQLLSTLAASPHSPNLTLMASIWSPPHYMKSPLWDTLLPSYSTDYLHYIENITVLAESLFPPLRVSHVSPVNEPENIFAPWEHTNMSPSQLCSLVGGWGSTLVSLCPENAYYWMSEVYGDWSGCGGACKILASHAYTLDIDYWSPNRLLAYYDLAPYPPPPHNPRPIWITEVSSTYPTSGDGMKEALDLAQSIFNFVGLTCVQRYYYWNMYTWAPSGEGLIWSPQLDTPKKYWAYRHFTLSTSEGGECGVSLGAGGRSLSFLRSSSSSTTNTTTTTVFLNKERGLHYRVEGTGCLSPLCCTTEEYDWNCVSGATVQLPKRSICSCTTYRNAAVNGTGEEEIKLVVEENNYVDGYE